MSSDARELGPPLCSNGAPASDNTYACALRALIVERSTEPVALERCRLRHPCAIVAQEALPKHWIDDPDGSTAVQESSGPFQRPYRVLRHDWGSDGEPTQR